MKPKKLHTNAPILAKIRKKTNSFEVPANYFDTFEDGVLAELHAEKLPFTSKKTFFEIPEDYLNTIEDNLITKISLVLNKDMEDEIPFVLDEKLNFSG